MSAADDFGDVVRAWAERTPAVKGLVLIGSRERADTDVLWRADAESDWDFQIITDDPRCFANADWTRGLVGAELRVYAPRVARIGGVPKVNAIFAGAEADFVVIPAHTLRLARLLVALGLHHREGRLRRALQDLAVVIRPGWRFLKGGETWEPFYRRVVAEVADARLGDEALCALANTFVTEWVWTRRKIARGERIAAQRMLHRELAETNFRLLHELKLRRGERSFPEARRMELVGTADELAGADVSAALEGPALLEATERCAANLRVLMAALVGTRWRWPI